MTPICTSKDIIINDFEVEHILLLSVIINCRRTLSLMLMCLGVYHEWLDHSRIIQFHSCH